MHPDIAPYLAAFGMTRSAFVELRSTRGLLDTPVNYLGSVVSSNNELGTNEALRRYKDTKIKNINFILYGVHKNHRKLSCGDLIS